MASIQTILENATLFGTCFSSSQVLTQGLLGLWGSQTVPDLSGEFGEHQGCGYTVGSSLKPA